MTPISPPYLRCIVRKLLKSNLELRCVDYAVEGVAEKVHLGQPFWRGLNAEWFIKHELRAYGLVVQNSPNVNGESNCGVRDLLFDVALDERATVERIWSAPEGPQPCGRRLGLLYCE